MQRLTTPTMTRRRLLLAAPVALSQAGRLLGATAFDLIIRGGRVIDPSRQFDRVADVGIRAGKIAAVGPNLGAGTQVIEAAGKIVAPGLIDIHTHVAETTLTPAQLLATGVTCLVDGGSRGSANVADLVKIAQGAPNRVRILLNISRRGLADGGTELLNIENVDTAATRSTIEASREWIVGIKARLSRSAAGTNDLEALRRARQVADALKIPIMIHMGDTASPLPDLLALLKTGDIVTHMYAPAPHGILDDNKKVLPQVIAARKRGVLFDIGNGRSAHWTWEVAERALEQGFPPDTISSDITAASLTSQVFNLPHVMSKFLHLGMPLDQVVARATSNAARAIGPYKNYGTLRPGAVADVAILDLQEGDVEFEDNYGGKRAGRRKLVPSAVVLAGKKVGS